MERIKKAVERARAERGSSAPPESADAHVGTDAPASPQDQSATTGREVAAVKPGSALDVIDYQQTQVKDINTVHLNKNRIISLNKSDVRSLNFDRLRTQVLQKMNQNGWRTLAITSPTFGNGKTTVGLNLAFSIAQHTEQTVLLVDFDLKQPRVAEYLGLPEGPSLVNYLKGEVPLSDVFVNPGIPRLTLLPNHISVKNAAETLMTTKVRSFVADVRDRYESRLVIFDLPPLLSTDVALAFLPQVDAALMVIASGMTTKNEARDAMRLIADTNLVGVVLNKSETIKMG